MATKQSLPQEPAAGVKRKKKKRRLPIGVVERNGHHYVVVRYREGGKRHAAWRRCEKNPTHAKEVRAALKRELEDRGPQSLKHSQMAWLQLSKHFREHYLTPAKFVDDRLVSGYRSIEPVQVSLDALDAFFGNKPIRKITRGDLRTYKRQRLDTSVSKLVWQRNEQGKRLTKLPKVRVESQRSITSVNKEMRTARHLFNIAVDEDWLSKNPFKRNDKLISAADEPKRERTASPTEEAILLAGCRSKQRTELRRRIILAIDSGMREGEMTKLHVGACDFDTSIITIKASHTKTLTARKVRMTNRVRDELMEQCAGKKSGERVFSSASVKTSWTNLRNEVGLQGLRWHDLRHTNATRIEKSQRVSAGQLQRHLGHADRRSTERYVNQDDDAVFEISEALEELAAKAKVRAEAEMIGRAVDALDAMHAEREEKETVH
jgi:integrase